MPNFFSKIIGGGIKKKRPYCSAIVPAAGSSTRMEGTNKLFAYIDGIPVIVYTLLALSNSEEIDEIVVVTRTEDILNVGKICKDYNITKVTKVIKGGDTRTKSVLAGLAEISKKAEIVAVHDAARPLICGKVISEAVNCAALTGAAAPAVALKDTIRMIDTDGKMKTLDRDKLFAIQTPQVFQTEIIRGALTKAVREDVNLTDDCEAVMRMGMNVQLTAGSYENIKITTPEDIKIAQAFILGREEN